MAIAAVGLAAGCSSPQKSAVPPLSSPNILWVMWDTARADHLGLYGYPKPTTPYLDRWARTARVYDDCISAAPYTVASHASMFTGLLPTEHGASNSHQLLEDRYATIAELLRDAGYQTYLFSANPHISRVENFQQGFEVAEHPWDAKYEADAYRIIAGKIASEDKSSELPDKIRKRKLRGGWDIKACGALAQRAAEAWLAKRDPRRPFFVFLNYMEAHRPWIPPETYRRRMMTPEQVPRSYQIDRSWLPLWSYTFRLHDYTDEELEIMAATYDASLAELDDLFRQLLESLQVKGLLDNTVVVLTSDHGEHLGEHHILDHQYSLYEPLLRVPLVIRDEARFRPGRDARPVTNMDLFPTLLQVAGVEVPSRRHAVSLLAPAQDRVRIGECLGVFRDPFSAVASRHPGWDSTPWEREIRALYRGGNKLIRWGDGHQEMYALRDDPREEVDLAATDVERARKLDDALARYVAGLEPAALGEGALPQVSDEHRERLRSLGYVHDGGDASEKMSDPSSKPERKQP